MAAIIDPTTGQPLPADAIQRLLFVAPKVHVYQIPPLTSTKGYAAAAWTTDPQRHIFTARLRVLETGTDADEAEGEGEAASDLPEKVRVDIVLEDPSSGQLFAAAPYTAADVVEAALDSARFYALRVQDPQGRRAMLGLGFEERPESFDFSVTLQEARKTIGLERTADAAVRASAGRRAAAAGSAQQPSDEDAAARRDYSLKDGETITVNLSSSKFGRRANTSSNSSNSNSAASSPSPGGFSLPPPPPPPPAVSSVSSSAASSFSLPPPPSANRRASARRSVGDPNFLSGFNLQQQHQLHLQQQQQQQQKQTAADLGFDDGQNDEFA
ncbi:adaptin ear-binding coat-associated protein 2 [Grosmannia clavigera kw1407]|uniref:Adaptin ear-binding coat-associated protein 2 n=1 Tax=Grosmannia clavigera (strain kw1407 / UAMH 11150) TaxID=655863 RepID=F0XFH0_GROCL|nr:adaptin ear-binding coat-associated protein 2 [Grosmannia clavigera kw1407]EFX04474.1 adaptin ear-binding coat-associated protein 2 [Grosmannia clavigera kw1407]